MGRGLWVGMLIASVLSSCELDGDAGRGDPCVRTSQCQRLLACIDGACTRDLDSVAEQSTVPDLARDAAAPAMEPATVSDAAVGSDAAVATDAGMPAEPMSDAGGGGL